MCEEGIFEFIGTGSENDKRCFPFDGSGGMRQVGFTALADIGCMSCECVHDLSYLVIWSKETVYQTNPSQISSVLV